VGLAAAVTSAAVQVNGQTVTATDFVPDSPTPPHFVVAEFVNEYHETFGSNAMDRVMVKCRLLTSRGSDAEGQRALRKLATLTGSGSIPAALEAARGAPGQMALNGAAADLALVSVTGPRLYEIGAVDFYGLEFSVLVIG
jgi:hypothetical protein